MLCGRRPKNERLRVGDELDDDLGHDLGGQKILLNCHPDPHQSNRHAHRGLHIHCKPKLGRLEEE